jgi:uncharacterized membrane protein
MGAALVFLVAGIAHFVAVEMLARFIPPWLPAPVALVWISGAVEVAGGAGLLVAGFRRGAAWMLSLMLVSFLPANIFMATHPLEAGVGGLPVLVLWTRIALLPVMVGGLFWAAGVRRGPGTSVDRAD